MRWIALAALAAIGCGGGEPGDPLDGTTWGIESTTTYCGQFLGFRAGEYRELLLCGLTDGSFGLQEWSGPYVVSGERLTLHVDRASCNWLPGQSETLSWAINGSGNLTLQNPSSVVVMQRITSSNGATFAGTFGCFDDTGGFTPMPVHGL